MEYESSNPEKKAPAKGFSNSFKDYFRLGPVFGYFFRGKDPERPVNFNLRMMHGINKISMIMFLVGVVFFIIKLLNR